MTRSHSETLEGYQEGFPDYDYRITTMPDGKVIVFDVLGNICHTADDPIEAAKWARAELIRKKEESEKARH
jgi:hypothetical protein